MKTWPLLQRILSKQAPARCFSDFFSSFVHFVVSNGLIRVKVVNTKFNFLKAETGQCLALTRSNALLWGLGIAQDRRESVGMCDRIWSPASKSCPQKQWFLLVARGQIWRCSSDTDMELWLEMDATGCVYSMLLYSQVSLEEVALNCPWNIVAFKKTLCLYWRNDFSVSILFPELTIK